MRVINSKLEKKKFWESYLNRSNGFSKIQFHYDLKNTKDLGSSKSKSEIKIDDILVKKIEKLTNGSDYLVYVIFSSVLQTCLHKYTNNHQTLVGTPFIKKIDKDIKNINVLPLITDFNKVSTFKDLLNYVKKELSYIYENQEFPLENLTSELSIDTIENELLDFSIMFEGLHDINHDSNYIDFKFSKNHREGLTGWVYYHKNLYNQEAVDEFKKNYMNILSQVLEDLNIDITEIRLQSTTFAQDQKFLSKEVEYQALYNKLLEHNSVMDVNILNEDEKITAYIIGAPNKFRSTHMLMKFLKETLSTDLLPHEIKWVEILPEKVDEVKDELTKVSLDSECVLFTKAEKIVQTVWSEVLGLDKDSIKLEDDFFEIGGDSISSMQVYFKLRELGFGLSPQDMIATPYIRDMAEKYDVTVALNTDQSTVSGKVKLTPSQEWFFEKGMYNVNYFNNFVSVKFRKKFHPSTVKSAVDALIKHHDVLRTKFTQLDGIWEQYIEPVSSGEIFEHYDIGEISEFKQVLTINSIFEECHKKINITNGPIIKFIHIARNNEPDYLGIIGHRLITDGVTLEILLEDLFRGMEQLDANEELKLPVKSTSFMSWSSSLDTYINTEQFKQNSIYWNNKKINSSSVFFEDDIFQSEALEKNTKILLENLDKETTTKLEMIASQYLRTGMREIVFSTFLKTMNQWTQSRDILIETGGHGRENINEDMDLTRTAGWFTTNYPVLLSMPTSSDDITLVIKCVKEQLNEIPLNGFDYGILRYKLNQKNDIFGVNPLIGLDYQGRFSNSFNDSRAYTITDLGNINERDLKNQRIYLFDISSWIEDGKFVLRWSFDEHQFKEVTIKNLMKNFLDNLISITETHKNFSL